MDALSSREIKWQKALSAVDFLAVPSVQVMAPTPEPGNQRTIQESGHTTPKSPPPFI
jgi:hypothetical protein